MEYMEVTHKKANYLLWMLCILYLMFVLSAVFTQADRDTAEYECQMRMAETSSFDEASIVELCQP